MTKKQTKMRQALPPNPSGEAVRLGALRALMELVSADRDETEQLFTLVRPGMFADECLESPEAAFARIIARGEHPSTCAAALGVDYDVIAVALVDLARGARVNWNAPAPGRKAVA